jgi:SAM-dependent methyltransferase
MSINEPSDFGVPPWSGWTLRGPADDLGALLHRAAEFLDSVGANHAVREVSLRREGEQAVVDVAFDHWQLPADLDYLDPRVAHHDTDDRRDDFEFMVEVASQLDARTVVDLGCGAGRLAVMLASAGRRVIGVDPSKAMIDRARRRDGAERVEWLVGDVFALGAREVDLVVMTGNIPSTRVTDEAWDQLLRGVRTVLRVGGHVAFGSWNPRARRWETWDWDPVVLPIGDGGARVGSGGRLGLGMELVAGREWLSAPSVWRYRTQEELTASLSRAGFEVEQGYGDWDRSPLTPTSPDIVLVARRVDRGGSADGSGVDE